MKPIIIISLFCLMLHSCSNEGNPPGFYGSICPDADYTVQEIPEDLPKRIRQELTNNITHDSIIGKIPYRVCHPVDATDCETLYDEYRVSATVKLSTGKEVWDVDFVRKKNGKLWCQGCNKSAYQR
ncbi:MAG: hypothetical protein HWE22_19845 [Flavobacteriales bacterium]|nr:hypothetical protein [Flavobacteriales bacterium]